MHIHFTRRDFIAGVGALGVCSYLPQTVLAKNNYDVIVVGSGAGGFTAAIRAAENGAKVLLLEANSWTGGASRVATGIFGCAGHPIQKALGFTTTPEDLYKLYISVASATKTKADAEVARILADGAIGAADWLASLGVEWSTQKAQKFFLNIKAGHRLGEFLIDCLEKKAISLGVELRTNNRVTDLLTDNGRIVGIRSETPNGNVSVRAPAVVLATGGFEANPEMIATYIGNGWEKAGVYCTPTNRGDGQRMAEKIGVQLADMQVMKANPTIHVSQGNKYNLISAVRAGAIAVNKAGMRFMNETGGYYESLKIWSLPEKRAWLIFGETTVTADPRLARLVTAGSIIRGQSISELAKKTGINAESLEKTVAHYKELVKTGKDTDFGRGSLKNVFDGELFAASFSPMIQGTFGGIKTNTQTQAMRPDGSVYAGLYAVGECAASGLRGVNPQTANVVFGSIAGRNAVRYAKKIEGEGL